MRWAGCAARGAKVRLSSAGKACGRSAGRPIEIHALIFLCIVDQHEAADALTGAARRCCHCRCRRRRRRRGNASCCLGLRVLGGQLVPIRALPAHAAVAIEKVLAHDRYRLWFWQRLCANNVVSELACVARSAISLGKILAGKLLWLDHPSKYLLGRAVYSIPARKEEELQPAWRSSRSKNVLPIPPVESQISRRSDTAARAARSIV